MDQIIEFDVKDLPDLKDWLKSQFIEFKPGAGSYQLIRIQTSKRATGEFINLHVIPMFI